MKSIKIGQLTAVKRLKNKEFADLYEKLMDATEHYVDIVKEGDILLVYARMQETWPLVQKLKMDLALRRKSLNKQKRVKHTEVLHSLQYLKEMLKSYRLLPNKKVAKQAEILYPKMCDLLEVLDMRMMNSLGVAIDTMKEGIAKDKTLSEGLEELKLMDAVEAAYQQYDEYKLLLKEVQNEEMMIQKYNKGRIRSAAYEDVDVLFAFVEHRYMMTQEKVWEEMAQCLIDVVTRNQ